MLQVSTSQVAITKDLCEKTGTDSFAGMNGNDSGATIGVAQDVVAAFDAANGESGTRQRGDKLLPRQTEWHLSGDGDALNTDEAKVFRAFSLGIETKLNSFPNPLH